MLAIIFAGCKSTQNQAYSVTGSWNYEISNTPYGDFKGTMVLSKNDGAYEGVLLSDQNKVALRNLEVDENNLMKARFSFEGNDLLLKGSFIGETFSGTVALGYDNVFDMKATRKK